jgi:crotonobetainyl-CoA:carnitine CoA-transferase CaiB-like acyl-CoA transferase
MDVELDAEPRGPLAGVRVLDLSAVVSGPMCTQILGDLGADVVKLEAPGGDTARRLGPPFKGGLSGYFAHFNRNKRSLAVDLKSEEGRALVRRLARGADVLVQNFRPGVAERLGLAYEDLAEENPGLLYVSISGFGPDGPYRDLPAYDTVIQGLTGFLPVQGGDGPPRLVRGVVADKTTALTAAYAIVAALYARERQGGCGQRIDVPMLDAYAAFMLPDSMIAEAFLPTEPLPFSPGDVHRVWQTADGWVVMMIIEDHQFQGLCRAIEREDLLEDPRCANLITRIVHSRELFAELADELVKWPTAELLERGRRLGAPIAPANSIADFLADPQVQANRTVFETEHPEAGRMRLLRNPVRFERTPTSLRHLPPRLGEQTDALLREAGLSDDEIARLRASGAVR